MPVAEDFLSDIPKPTPSGGESAPPVAEDFLSDIPVPKLGQASDQSQTSNRQNPVAMVTKALGQGMVNTAGLPGDLAQLLQHTGLVPSWVPSLPKGFLPTSEEANKTAQRRLETLHSALGLPPGDIGFNPKPQGTMENAIAGGASGLGGGLVTGPLSVAGAGASVAGGMAASLAKSLGLGTVGQVIAGMAGGFGTGAAGNMVKTAQAAKNVENLTSSLANAKANLDASMVAKPGALGQIKTEAKNQIQSVVDNANALKDAHLELANNTINTIADLHGKSQNYEEAGGKLQDWARTYLTQTMKQKNAEDFAPVDAALPAETPSGLHTLVSTLKDINEHGGELSPLIQALSPRLPAKLQDIFESISENPSIIKGTKPEFESTGILDSSGKPIQKMVSPGTPDKPITWGSSGQLQTRLGELLGDPMILKDLGQQNANRIYGAVLNDRMNTAEDNGVGAEFAQARANAEKRFNFAEGPISKIIAGPKASSDDRLPGDVAKKLVAAGATDSGDIKALKAEGAPIGELTSAAIREGQWPKLAEQTKAQLINKDVAGVQTVPSLDVAHQLLKAAPQEAKDTIKQAQGQIMGNRDQQVESLNQGIAGKKAGIADLSNQLAAMTPAKKVTTPYATQEDIAKAVSGAIMKHIGASMATGLASHALGGSLPLDVLAGLTPEVLSYLKSKGLSSGLTPVVRGALGGNSLTP